MTLSNSKADPAKDRIDHVLLGALLTVLTLRVTFTEAPPIPLSNTSLNFTDSFYSISISCLLLTIAAMIWLRTVWGLRAAYRWTGLELGLGVLFIVASIACIDAADKRLALNNLLIFFAPACAALALVQLLHRIHHVRLVLIFLVVLGLLSTLQSLDQYTTDNAQMIKQYQDDPASLMEPLGIDPNTLQHFMLEHRLYSKGVRSYFTTRNSAGSFGLLSLFAFLTLLQYPTDKTQNRYTSILYLILLACLGMGLLLTRSKGAMLGLLVGLGCLGLGHVRLSWLHKHRRSLLVVVFISVILASIAIGLYGFQNNRLPGGNSMLVRWQYWQAAARMIADHPWFGVGPGNFASYYTHYKVPEALETVADPHNFLLSLCSQLGLFSLVGMMLLIWIPLTRSAPPHVENTAPTEIILGPSRTQYFIMILALALSFLMFRPALNPLPTTDNMLVTLYLFISQRFIPLAIGIGIGLWLIQRRASFTTDQHQAQRLKLIPACGILAVLIANLTDFAIFEPPILTAFWLLVACALAGIPKQDIQKTMAPIGIRLVVSLLVLTASGLIYTFIVQPVSKTTTLINQAHNALEKGNSTLANRALEQATHLDPLSPLAPDTRGRTALGSMNHQSAISEAITYFNIAIERNNADYRYYEHLAQAYDAARNIDRAYEAYAQAAQRYPGCARFPLAMGRLSEKRNDFMTAKVHYQRAIFIEESFQKQFMTMYPERKSPVSRLGFEGLQFAKERLALLETIE